MPAIASVRVFMVGLVLGTLAAGPAGSVTVKSADGSIQMTAPAGWIRGEPPSPGISLLVLNDAQQCGAMIIAEDRTDLALTLAQYARRAVDQLKQSPALTDQSATALTPVKVGSHVAQRCTFRCSTGGMKLAYVLTFVQGDHDFLDVQAWAVADQFDRDRPLLETIAANVRELAVAPVVSPSAAAVGPAVTIEGKDHSDRLTLPAGFAQADLPPDASPTIQMMATNATSGANVLLSTESRAGTTLTLAQYAQRMVDAMSKTTVNTDTSHTPFKPVKVAGHDALRCEFRSTTNGVRLEWLLTAIQTDKNFDEVNGWTARSKFAAMEKDLAKLSNGFEELAGKPVVIEGKDHTVRLTLPSGFYKSDLPAGMAATVQLLAVDDDDGVCVTVVTEPAQGLTLALPAYGEAVVASMAKSQANADLSYTPFVPVKVNGHDAARCELQSTTNKTPLTWLITVLRVGDTYVQLNDWCPKALFGKAKPLMARLPDGFEEVTATAGHDGTR